MAYKIPRSIFLPQRDVPIYPHLKTQPTAPLPPPRLRDDNKAKTDAPPVKAAAPPQVEVPTPPAMPEKPKKTRHTEEWYTEDQPVAPIDSDKDANPEVEKTIDSAEAMSMSVYDLIDICQREDFKGLGFTVGRITPEIAAIMLKFNTRNRKPRWRNIHRFARDMRANRWTFTPDAIGVDTDGLLTNGQNRLYAVIEAGVEVDIPIMTGLKPDSFGKTDVLSPRTLGDYLRNESARLGRAAPIRIQEGDALLRRLWEWENGYFETSLDNKMIAPTHSELLAMRETYPDYLDVVRKADMLKRAFRGISPSAIGLCYMLFRKVDLNAAEEFLSSVATGKDLEYDNPIAALRRRFQNITLAYKSTRRTVNLWEIMALTIKAWNYWRSQEPREMLVWKQAEPFPRVDGLESEYLERQERLQKEVE